MYKAKNNIDDNEYAVKKIMLDPKEIKNKVESSLQRVIREARHLAKISHPNIIRYYNCWFESEYKEEY